MFLQVIGVACGGFIGGGARAYISEKIPGPFATLLVNLIACAALGAIHGGHFDIHPWVFFVIATGVAGGLSTWPKLVVETVVLWQNATKRKAIGLVAAHIVFGYMVFTIVDMLAHWVAT